MKFQNLRVEKYNGKAWLKADMECSFTTVNQLWFSVPEEYADYLSDDIYDAILVAALYPAMYYGEPIEIEGCVTEQLYRNITAQITAILQEFSASLHPVPIKVLGYATAKKNNELHVGTGFSGGVDSFCTLQDHFFNEASEHYKVDTIFFFNVGQNGKYGEKTTNERTHNRYLRTESFCRLLHLPCIMMDCNLFSFYRPEWELTAGVLCRIMSVLVFQRALKRYYISSTYNYGEMIQYGHKEVELASYADSLIISLLSPPRLDIVCDGLQYTRCEKTKNIINSSLARKYLNVCVNGEPEFANGKNCSRCSKCLRTLVALESAGHLQDFAEVFDLDVYRKHAYHYKCEQRLQYNTNAFAHDNVDFAERNGHPFPSLKEARRYMRKRTPLLVLIKAKIRSVIARIKNRFSHH